MPAPDCPQDEPQDILYDAMTGPRRVVSDGIDVQARSASELIALIRFARSTGASCGFHGITAQQAIPPNAMGVNLGYSDPALHSRRIW